MKMKRPLQTLLLSLGIAAAAQAASLTLSPASGALSGAAGSTVGWGFTLSNPTDFAVVTSSNFCLGSSGITTLCIAPNTGTYSDEIANNFTIAGPSPESPVVTQAFNSAASMGVGSFTINAGAVIGTVVNGQIVLTYDLYSVDPLSPIFDPIADLISTGSFLSDPATVTVTGAPEPSSWLLVAAGGVLILCRRRSK
jgi:hypothetical protein